MNSTYHLATIYGLEFWTTCVSDRQISAHKEPCLSRHILKKKKPWASMEGFLVYKTSLNSPDGVPSFSYVSSIGCWQACQQMVWSTHHTLYVTTLSLLWVSMLITLGLTESNHQARPNYYDFNGMEDEIKVTIHRTNEIRIIWRVKRNFFLNLNVDSDDQLPIVGSSNGLLFSEKNLRTSNLNF